MFHCFQSSTVGSGTGALVLVLLQGVCVWGDESDERVSAVVGGTVVLSSGYQREDVKSAEWNFNKLIIAEYAEPNIKVDFIEQFKGRLEMNPYNFSLTVSKLTKKDSGRFLFTGTGTTGTQLKAKTFLLQVYDSTLTMNVVKNVTLLQPNNTCMVSLLCNASGGPDVSFSWSGYRTGSEANLRFPLSPADGRVILTCTAVRDQTTKETKVTLKCDNKTLNDSGESDVVNPTPPTRELLEKLWYPVFCGDSCSMVVVGPHHSQHSSWCVLPQETQATEQDTVYADVNPDQKQTPRRSLSGPNEMSIYETVNEGAIGIQSNPQTLYDKINFTRQGGKKDICTRAIGNQSNPQTLYDKINFTRQGGKSDVCPTLSSPYQEV
ncbi:uncharacterized protein LOC122132386 [Clupea harengus]|uniref:Uncharacterized protein LOC122132386 n=1 Tax=Clupea harengus TaxID=7950 RepID=A0A8M1KG97_CLUHA|nr:uncharacterized protein LOC122132386 [Clupea harengus]